ncbi:MAG: YhcH/YjgK/YiaL family protein [Phycisphaerae bacterium]|nr:YhcH/YjgK/YiaL family protein [Phycisphaerae bacterium]
MIVDSIHNASAYRALSGRIAAALTYLAETDFTSLPDGRDEIQGDEVFAIVQRYQTKPLEQGKWEAHRKYIDVQGVIEGQERIGFGDVTDMRVVEEYCPESDLVFLDGSGEFVTLSPGMFMLLFPHEAHMPCITSGQPSQVTKVVVKILAE